MSGSWMEKELIDLMDSIMENSNEIERLLDIHINAMIRLTDQIANDKITGREALENAKQKIRSTAIAMSSAVQALKDKNPNIY